MCMVLSFVSLYKVLKHDSASGRYSFHDISSRHSGPLQYLCYFSNRVETNHFSLFSIKLHCDVRRVSLCMFDARAVHHLIFHCDRLTEQNGIMDGGEQTGLCHFVSEETSSLQVVHHTSWKETERERIMK